MGKDAVKIDCETIKKLKADKDKQVKNNEIVKK